MKSIILKHRKIIFVFVAIALFFFILTVILGVLEERKIIDTQRSDDQVTYLDREWLEKIKTDNGWIYQIQDRSMIKSSFVIPKKKRTYRILVSGGSFAMGSPYVVQFENDSLVGGFPDWVKAELELRFPSRQFELINAAAGGQNSNRVRQIVNGLASAEPDLMIVATGNNEGYVSKTRLNESLHKWTIYRLLKKSIKPSVALHQRKLYTPQYPETKKIEKQFQENIQSIIDVCKKAGVPLILCTLPINLKYAGHDPQVHGETPDIPDDKWIIAGMTFLDQKKYNEALEAFSKSKNVGKASFYMAQILESKKKYKEAIELYQLHVQHFPKNRTRPSYNDFLRKTTERSGVFLADLDMALQTLSPHEIISPGLFVDYCHLNLNGYYLAAREIVNVIIDNNLVPLFKGEPLPAVMPKEIILKNKWDENYFSKMKNKYPMWKENFETFLQSDYSTE